MVSVLYSEGDNRENIHIHVPLCVRELVRVNPFTGSIGIGIFFEPSVGNE